MKSKPENSDKKSPKQSHGRREDNKMIESGNKDSGSIDEKDASSSNENAKLSSTLNEYGGKDDGTFKSDHITEGDIDVHGKTIKNAKIFHQSEEDQNCSDYSNQYGKHQKSSDHSYQSWKDQKSSDHSYQSWKDQKYLDHSYQSEKDQKYLDHSKLDGLNGKVYYNALLICISVSIILIGIFIYFVAPLPDGKNAMTGQPKQQKSLEIIHKDLLRSVKPLSELTNQNKDFW